MKEHLIDVLAVGHAPVLQINRRIYSALRQIGWNVELAIPRHLPWVSKVEDDCFGDPVIHRLEPIGEHLRFWRFKGLKELLEAKRPRIVYLENSPESMMAWTIGGWCVQNNAALVANTNENDIWSIHEICRRRNFTAAVRAVRSHIWGRLARRRVRYVVALCEDGRKAMQAIGFKNNVGIVPLGFDPALFFPDADRRAAMREKCGFDEPVIAYFGRLIPAKGVQILIAALGRLKHQRWKLLLDDFEQEDGGWLSNALDEAGIRDRVVTFSASHLEIADYMRAADIAVLPSLLKEQFGRVVAEAMGCACCVVVSDMGALPELVGDAGIIVPHADTAALTKTIDQLLKDASRRAMLASRAATRAQAELSLRRQAQLLDSIFRNVIGLPGSESSKVI